MKFKTGVKTFSLSEQTKKTFEELDHIRPNNISFSSFLGIVASEYIANRRHGYTIDTFVDNVSAVVPHIFSDVEKWKSFIEKSPSEDIIKLQNRTTQIRNLIDFKLRKILC